MNIRMKTVYQHRLCNRVDRYFIKDINKFFENTNYIFQEYFLNNILMISIQN